MQALATTFGWKQVGEGAAFDGVCTDTRQLVNDQLFVALRGENFDGHRFVKQALEQGAAGALVSEAVADAEPLLIAEDTLQGLGQLAAQHRARFAGEVFAVTGSAGKTTTKEMLAAILSQRASVLATQGNFNNEIGVPLTLLQLREKHRHAVIEMGAAKPGDIQYLVQLARPTTSILTNALPAHMEGFGSVEQVARTKGEIFVPEATTVSVVNLDEPFAAQWQAMAEGSRVLSYSANGNDEADVQALDVVPTAGGVGFNLLSPIGRCKVQLQVPGTHNVANALAAATAALSRGIDIEAVEEGLNSFSGVASRLQFLHASSGQVVIDDSYNANPAAVHSALDVLARQAGPRVFIFGGMAELGAQSEVHHRAVGEYARQCGIDLVVTVGAEAAQASTAFGSNAIALQDQAELQQWLRDGLPLAAYRTCLVKGSRSAGMERAVATLMELGGVG